MYNNSLLLPLCKLKRQPKCNSCNTLFLTYKKAASLDFKSLKPRILLSFGRAKGKDTSTRNAVNPYTPTVMFASENYWPVKIKHYSNGKRKWIYIHEDEPSVQAFLQETKAIERARGRGTF